MKSVVFLRTYNGVIQEGTKCSVNDDDYLAWRIEGYVEEISFESGLGIYLKSVADMQSRAKNNVNYNRFKLEFADTFRQKGQDDKRCDIVSNYIIDEYKIKTMRDANGDEFWYKQNGVYIPNGRTIIRECAIDFFGHALNSAILKKIEVLTEAKTYIEPDKFFENYDKKRIGVANGILNLETMQLENFESVKTNIFVRIPVKFNPEAKCPNFEKFLSDVLEKPQHISTIQELLGFCLLPEYKYEKIFIWTGTGRNGKSKLISIFKSFLGMHNCTAHSLQTLQRKEYCLAEMHNKLANVGGDISGEALRETDIIKQITGQDLISANRKFKEYIHFVNYAKQIFACNELPTIYDSSIGFWNRINRIDFPYTFYEESELQNLSEDKKKYAKLRNENILENILTEEELSGILNYAMLGLMILKQSGQFSNATETTQVRSSWLRKTSSFFAFIEDYFDYDISAMVSTEHVNALYDIFCANYCLEQVPPNQRAEHVRTFSGKPVSIISKKIDNETYRAWKGIKLKKVYCDKITDFMIAENKELTLESFNQVKAVQSVQAVCEKLEIQKMI